MSEDKKDIEFVTVDTPVKEFISKEKKDSKTSKKTSKGTDNQAFSLKAFYETYTKPIWYTGCIVLLLLFLGLSIFLLQLPIVTVGIVLLIEAALTKCLEGLPIWGHIVLCIFQIVMGIVVAQVLFMIFASILYFVFLIFLNYITKNA